MEPPIQDSGKGWRLLKAVLTATFLAAVVGGLSYLEWVTSVDPRQYNVPVFPPYVPWVRTSSVIFWAVFLILYVTTVRKSTATLEYQERIRRDREVR